MNIPAYAVEHRAVIVFSTVLLVLAGLWAYAQLGQLEDPEFTIKSAVVTTPYPGASPIEVEELVSDVLEKAIQELEGVDFIQSTSKAGISIIQVDMLESYRAPQLPQIWDKLRDKVGDAQSLLPPEALPSTVHDDFGDVYGIFLALTGDGYTYAELKDHADMLQRELLLVDDVAKVELWGLQQECIDVEISRTRLAELGIHPLAIVETLQRQNEVVDAGAVDVGSERIRFAPSGTFRTVEEIGGLVVRGGSATDLVLVQDVATVSRGYADPPGTLMRFNGKRAIGLSISTVSGGNVVDMGDDVQKRLSELIPTLPVGIEIGTVSYQAKNVRKIKNSYDPKQVTAFIEAARSCDGLPLPSTEELEEVATNLSASPAEIGLIWMGGLNMDSYANSFLPANLRKVLGWKAVQADAARQSLRNLDSKVLAHLYLSVIDLFF